jgi:hypothetical protein
LQSQIEMQPRGVVQLQDEARRHLPSMCRADVATETLKDEAAFRPVGLSAGLDCRPGGPPG